MSRRGRAAAGAVLGVGLVVAVGCATGAGSGEVEAATAGVVAPLPLEEPAAQGEQTTDQLGGVVAGEPASASARQEESGAGAGPDARTAAPAAGTSGAGETGPATHRAQAPAETATSPGTRADSDEPPAASSTPDRPAPVAPQPPVTAASAATPPPPPSPSSSGGSGEVSATGPSRARATEPVREELIVVDEGSSAVRPSPGELARTTRREAAGRGSAPRITNDNLADYARRGQVTMSGTPVAEKAAAGEAAEGAAAAEAEPAAEPVRDEAWWRARAREIREEWRRTVDEIGELEAAAADLRWRFYAEDDPWVRDGDVKPEWDRALDRLSEARRRLEEYPRRLGELVEEGRREGALPGWLREGIELEPAPEELPGAAADPAEPVEPREVDETGRGDGR